MVVADAVSVLVDKVLAGLDESGLAKCDRAKILGALDDLGCAASMADLREHMSECPDDIKGALSQFASSFFFVRFKKAITQSAGEPAGEPAGGPTPTPAAGLAADPAVQPATATLPVNSSSVVTTVKVGARVLVSSQIVTVATTTTFAELLVLVTANIDQDERANLATLPVTVVAYTAASQLSNQQAEAQLSASVVATTSLGYRHIVFKHAPPTQQPAARPCADAFQVLMGAGSLPDSETCGDGAELSFDKELFNWLLEMCKADKLSVRGDEVESCKVLLKAVRDVLQAIDGREGGFQYSLVPERFKAYKTGPSPVKRAKKPSKSVLKSETIRGYADKLQGAIDRHAFTRSDLWSPFIGDCTQLCQVMRLKYDQMSNAATAQAKRSADPTVRSGQIKPETIEPCEAGTIARYASLESMLLAKDCYDVVQLTEEMIGTLHPPSERAQQNSSSLRSHFQLYRDNMIFQRLAFKKFPALFGGQKKLILFLWRVPTAIDERNEEDNDRTVQLVTKLLPEIHSREVRREFIERFSHAVVHKNMLRAMYSLLTSDASAPENQQQRERDERALEYLLAGCDLELWPDLRALNSGERDKYNLFWEAGDKVCAALVTCAAENRHGNERTLEQPLSVPDFRRRVEEQLAQDGHTNAAIPSDDWIAYQFQPRCPTRQLAARYTGRWDITPKVLSTTLRKHNEDSHFCNALELNVKAFLKDANAVLMREFQALLDARESWARTMGDDAHISSDAIRAFLGTTTERIVRVSNDDKCKVPTGEPANPVGANVRPMAATPVALPARLLAMDHSWHRASVIPTVTLLTDLEHAFETNKWRNGQVVLVVKDSVLEQSSAFRNAAELAATILATCTSPIIIDKRTDGGPEQNMTFGSVQLADIALWKKTGADLLIHQRPAADCSWVNEVEGVMPLLNLALQHMATERLRMDPEFEALLANEGSMSAIREKIASIQDAAKRKAAEDAWLASLHAQGSPIAQLEKRFRRLVHTSRPVKIQPVATAEDITAMHALVQQIDPAWMPAMTTKLALLKLPTLQRFFKTHVITDKYIICVHKCGKPDCEFNCGPLRMPSAAFDELIGKRRATGCQIVPLPEHTIQSGKDHFDTYQNLKGRPTSEKHMPSFKPALEASADAKKADKATARAVAERAKDAKAELFHATRARLLVVCTECGKPRVIYSLARLTNEQKALAQSLIDDLSSYVCGATPLFPEGHELGDKLFVRRALTCGMPVEKQHYTSKQFRDCCSWCGTTDPLELEDLNRLNLNGAKGYSICKQCHADGKPVVTFGRASKTGAATNKAKGRARKAIEQYKVEIILAKKEFREQRKGIVLKWAVKWEGFDLSDEMTWEPASNLTNVRDELEAFERRLASMPKIGAFAEAAGSSACCFGSACKHPGDANLTKNPCVVCSKPLHHACAAEHLFLRPFYEKFENNNICFDCALLVALVEKRTPFGFAGGQLMFAPYYRQLRGVASLAPTPFGLGALLATGALKLLEPETHAARALPAVAKCIQCKSSEGELRACSFCKSGIYHDTAACLGVEREAEASLTHRAFPWCCPKCFKKGAKALESMLRAPVQPTGHAQKKRKR